MWIMKFYSFALDLDPMTLVLKLDLDIVKMYVYSENEVPSFGSSNIVGWVDTSADLTELLLSNRIREW